MIFEQKLQNTDETLIKVRQCLSEYGVHDLRNIARLLGVKAPTQFAKEKIILEIALIISDGKNCKYETRGRKPNKSALANEYDEVITKLKNLAVESKNSTAEQEEQFLPSIKQEADLLTQSVLNIKELLKTDDRMEIIIAVANVLKENIVKE